MVYSHSSKVQKQTKLNKMLFRDVCNHGEAGGGNTRGKHNGNTDKEKEMISRYS